MPEAVQHTEPLDIDELAFLQQMEAKDRKMYYKVYNVLMVMCFVIPFIGSWYRAFDGAPNAFSVRHFYLTAGILLAISTGGTYMSYSLFLRKIQADIRHKTKTIEICHILRKHYVPQNNTYHFYLDSSNKLSIEVPQQQYHSMDIGDEVCIEFTTHSKQYLGFF